MFIFSLPESDAKRLIENGEAVEVKINGEPQQVKAHKGSEGGYIFSWLDQKRNMVDISAGLENGLITFVCD